MNRLLSLLILLLLHCSGNAQQYKDSLLDKYKETYADLSRIEADYNQLLYKTAELTFSVKEPLMKQAMRETGLEDSAAMAVLGKETVRKFLEQDFLRWSCHHFEPEFEDINKFYTEGLCQAIGTKLGAAGRMSREELAKTLETMLMESSANMARDPSFREKAIQVREKYGTDQIIHSTECNLQYMYVHCPALQEVIINMTVGNAVDSFVHRKAAEQMRFFVAVKQYLLTGVDTAVEALVPEKAVASELYRSLAPIRRRVKELKPDWKDLLFRPQTSGDRTMVSYVFVSPQPEILGGIDMTLPWKDFNWRLQKSENVPEKDILNKKELLNVANIQQMRNAAPPVEVD